MKEMKSILKELNIDTKRYESKFYFRASSHRLDDRCIVTRLYDNNKVIYLAHIHNISTNESLLVFNQNSPISEFKDISDCEMSDGFFVGSKNKLSICLEELTGLKSDWVQCVDSDFGWGKYYLNSEYGRFSFDKDGFIVIDENNCYSIQDESNDSDEESKEKVTEQSIILMGGYTFSAGDFKPLEKFIEFVGAKGNVNFISNEALIEGKQLSGLGFEDKTFKLTIYEDGTVDFDDVENQNTTKEQRENLLNVITEKTIVPFRKRMVVRELTFTSVNEIDGKKVSLYLSVDYDKPINKLASIFDDEIEVEVTDSQREKLDALMSLFDDVEDSDAEKTTEKDIVVEKKEIQESALDVNKHLEDSFKKMKQEKVENLKKDLQHKKTELAKFERDKKFASSKVEEFTADIRLLESRIDSLQPQTEPNGWYFNVSERLNEKIVLEKEIYDTILSKVSKVKGINSEAFMKLFSDGEFRIRLARKNEDVFDELKDFEKLPEELIEIFEKLKLTVSTENKILYIGEIIWADLVNKFIKLGFLQDPEWEKICESNSYKLSEEII